MAEAKEFIVGLSGIRGAPREKRAMRTITALKRFAFKHFRAKPESVKVSTAVNELVWSRGRTSPPRKIDVKIAEEGGIYTIFLKGEKIPEKQKEKPKGKPGEKPKDEKAAPKPDEKPPKGGETEEQKAERKKEEKKAKEKAAEKSAIKRGSKK